MEIADALRSHGAAPRKDLEELWRRVVFSFDLNPTPTDERARILATDIDEHDGTASLDLALGTAR